MHLKLRHLMLAGAGGLVIGLALATAIHAQQRLDVNTPGISQTVLLNAPLAQFPGKQVLVFTGQFEPGASTPIHRHPGTELLYVLEGEGVMVLRGRESEQLTPGRVVLAEPDPGEDAFIHKAIHLSKTDRMKTLVFVIHDEGTPPALPVSQEQE